MNSRRLFLSASLCATLAGAAGCSSVGLVEYEDHARIEPAQPVTTGDKIEVIEFFWYGCPHCADMHPRLQAWAQRQPADVALRYEAVALRPQAWAQRQPADVALRYEAAALRPSWETGARIHFVLESMGESARLSAAVFEAAQLDGFDFKEDAAWFDWAARHGLDRQRVVALYRSPEADRHVKLASEVGDRYQLRGVPAFVVDGKYLTANGFTGSADDTLVALDKLVAKARDERARRAKAG